VSVDPGDLSTIVDVLMSAAHRIATAARLHWRAAEGHCAECGGKFPCRTLRILAGL
jgi:hypothetical protein